MARTYNIEIVHERARKHTVAATAVCSLAFALVLCCAAITGTWALESSGALSALGQSNQNVSSATQSTTEKLLLTEEWDASKGIDLKAGSTITKRPTITATDTNCQLTSYIQIKDTETGRVLDPTNPDDKTRLDLILACIWADPQGAISNNASYNTQELQDLAAKGVNNLYDPTNFSAPTWNANAKAADSASAGAYQFAYTANGGTFAAASSTSMFDHIVIPSGYTAEQLALMGKFSIVVWATASYDEPAPNPNPDTPQNPDTSDNGNNKGNMDDNANHQGDANGSKGKLAQTGDATRALMAIAAACAAAAVVLFVVAAKIRHASAQGGDGHEAR